MQSDGESPAMQKYFYCVYFKVLIDTWTSSENVIPMFLF